MPQAAAIAAAWGITYDLLTGDLTQANYSSLRAGRLAFKRRLEQIQWLLLIPRWCQPVWDAWIAAALRAGVLAPREGGYPVEWGPPAFEMVDPLKDALAEKAMLRMGLRTWGDAVAAQGLDPEKQLAEIVKWNKRFDETNSVFDFDARKVSNAGLTQARAAGASIPDSDPPLDADAATGAAVPRDPAAAMVQVVLSDEMGAALRAELAPAMASAEAAAEAARAATAENAEALRDLRATADGVALAMGDSRAALAGSAEQIAAAAASVAAAAERAAQPRTGVLVRDAQNRVTGVEYR